MEDRLRVEKKIGLLIQGRYLIKTKLSFGSYGSIYVAEDALDCDKQVLHYLGLHFRHSHN